MYLARGIKIPSEELCAVVKNQLGNRKYPARLSRFYGNGTSAGSRAQADLMQRCKGPQNYYQFHIFHVFWLEATIKIDSGSQLCFENFVMKPKAGILESRKPKIDVLFHLFDKKLWKRGYREGAWVRRRERGQKSLLFKSKRSNFWKLRASEINKLVTQYNETHKL